MASKCLSRTECGLAVGPVFITDPSVGSGPGRLREAQPLGGVVPRVRWQTPSRLPRNKMADMRNEGARWAIRGTSWDSLWYVHTNLPASVLVHINQTIYK